MYDFFKQLEVFLHASKGVRRKLARFLLENAGAAAFLRVSDIAVRIQSSLGTVSKVAQAMGLTRGWVPCIKRKLFYKDLP